MTKHAILFFLLNLFIAGFSIDIYSQAVQDNFSFEKDTILLNEIVVSGTKTQTNRNQTPVTISVVEREELEESSESAILPILSERIPGLFVTERGVTGFGISTGSAGTVNIHGVGGGNKVLMLFDGQPQWAGVFGHHIPDTYVSSDAERVEVIRGPASLLYGSNAMGGVINIITRKATENGIHGRGRFLYGSYNTQKYMANVGAKKDKFNAYLSLNHDRTDGQRENSDFKITNGYLKLGYDISENWDVAGNVILADFSSTNPGSLTHPMFDNWAEALRGTYSFSVNNNYNKMNGAIQGFYNFGNHKVNDGYTTGGNPLSYLFKSDDYNTGFSIYESFRLIPENLFTVGLDFKQWGGHAWNDSINGKTGEIIDKSVNEFAPYLLLQHTFLNKLTVNIGSRLEINETYGKEWVPQAGIAFRVNDETSFKASASKGFRSPNIRELYISVPANPDLKPEYMNNYDFSYIQKLFNNKFGIEFTAFFANGKNMIARTTVNGKPKNVNTGEFINKGFEFALNYNVLPVLNLSGNYSFLQSDIQTTGAPKHQAFVNANWQISKFKLGASYQFVSGLYTDTETSNKETYGLLSARASYSPLKSISFFVNGENLTDTSYQMYTGFPMPGIVVMGGFDFRF
ncbi:ligand-gated channel [Bacteroidia bacterium]|nr:ligand-gated channel [Bacteroidia bacterium]GHU89236.1 ligand-gated channel [Bacteroidia bacterium]